MNKPARTDPSRLFRRPALLSRYAAPLTILAILVMCFIAQRGGILIWGDAHIYYPGFDETVSGTLGYDMQAGGMRAPLFAYQYLDYTGDILLEAILLVPVYKIFGTSLLNLKLFALLSALITLVTWIIILERYQGLWAAVIFAALFAFPPPVFARLNLLGTPSAHHILNPIVAFQMLLLFRFFENRPATVPIWISGCLGLCAGLGTYTFYSHLMFNVACLCFLLVFRRSLLTLRNMSALMAGTLAGFSPWILRSFSSQGGWSFLKNLLVRQETAFDPWNVVLTFCFNLPHSLGFSYPARTIGVVSIGYALCLVIFCIIILRNSLLSHPEPCASTFRGRLQTIPLPGVFALFVCLFPPFFLLAVSASTKQIPLFEYWQNIGLFAPFPPLDCIRYRYFHVLYPFYFCIAAVGTIHVCTHTSGRALYKVIAIFLCTAMIWCGILKSIQMCSNTTHWRLPYYKGYNHELMAPFFMLGPFAPGDVSRAWDFAEAYPPASKSFIYQSLGTRTAMDMMNAPGNDIDLLAQINKTPALYLNDFIFGIIRTVHMAPEERFKPLIPILTGVNPTLFYTNWGFRYLAFKYYRSLINQDVLFAHIPPSEQWYYKKFISTFRRGVTESGRAEAEKNLLAEIHSGPQAYRAAIVSGLAKFIGAEMLNAPLLEPDYPLDSSFGRKLPDNLRSAFYQGIGTGFAETLCLFWNKILPSEAIKAVDYVRMLETEWARSQQLMAKMPADVLPEIHAGFSRELQNRNLNPAIKNYLADKNVLK